MRRVLIVGPDFSPSSLPSAQRVRFLASHLAEFGWQPTVLSVDPRHYETPVDVESEHLLPPGLDVIRTSAWSTRWTRRLGIGDIGMRSLWHQWNRLCRLQRTIGFHLNFISVPPYVSMVLGRAAYSRFGVPYVVDYQDPWVTEYYWRLPADQRPPKWAAAYALARLVEPAVIRRAGGVVGVSKGTIDVVLSRYPTLQPVATDVIPLGGEPGDFEYLRAHPRPNRVFDRADGNLHLCYAGVFIPQMIDAAETLFTAVKLGLDRNPALFARARLHFVGTSYSISTAATALRSLAERCGVSGMMTEQAARVSYLDSLQLMIDAHALLMLGSDEPHYTPSKLFPYILSKRPVVAIVHEESSAVSILRSVTSCQVATFSREHAALRSAPQVSAELERILQALPSQSPAVNWNAFEGFTARAMAGRLADVFERVAPSGASRQTVLPTADPKRQCA